VIEPLLQAERALDMGLIDQAERLYRGVADSDPRNSIAVVGLARVALERDDEAGALALARRATEIDPANPMAARLVARLEEVRAVRGEKTGRSEAAAVGSGPPAGGSAAEVEPAAIGSGPAATGLEPGAASGVEPGAARVEPPGTRSTAPLAGPADRPAVPRQKKRRRRRGLLDRLLRRR
jgi:hypothetical protein